MSYPSLPKKLKDLRLEHEYTQEDLGKYLSITRQGYAHYEKGGRNPDYKMLIKISQLYDVSLDYILNDAEEEKVIPRKSPYTTATYHTLSKREQKLLNFFSCLTTEEQDDLLIFLHIKNKRIEKEKTEIAHIINPYNYKDTNF